MKSGNSTKSAANSTPAAQPPASQAGAEDNDSLPLSGAERGDMFGIKASLAAELGQLSDGQNDESGTDADSEDSAKLDKFDDEQAAQAVDPAADAEGDEDADPAEAAAEGEEAKAQSDEAAAKDTPESEKPNADEEAKPAADAEKQKHEGFQSRIDELTSRAKTAEEQLATANEQLAAFRARDAGELSPDVLDHVESPEDLQAAKQRYSALLNWAIRNPEGGKLGEREYSAEDVRSLHAEVQSLISESVPARARYLDDRAKADKEALNFYPWLKETTRGAGAQVQQALKEIPALRRTPNYRLAVADSIVGQALRLSGVQVTDALLKRLSEEAQRAKTPGATQKPAQPARPAKPPAAPARAGVVPPRMSPRAAAAKAAGQRLRQSEGTEDDLAGSIAAKL